MGFHGGGGMGFHGGSVGGFLRQLRLSATVLIFRVNTGDSLPPSSTTDCYGL
jgi:hypothetical protein